MKAHDDRVRALRSDEPNESIGHDPYGSRCQV